MLRAVKAQHGNRCPPTAGRALHMSQPGTLRTQLWPYLEPGGLWRSVLATFGKSASVADIAHREKPQKQKCRGYERTKWQDSVLFLLSCNEHNAQAYGKAKS